MIFELVGAILKTFDFLNEWRMLTLSVFALFKIVKYTCTVLQCNFGNTCTVLQCNFGKYWNTYFDK